MSKYTNIHFSESTCGMPVSVYKPAIRGRKFLFRAVATGLMSTEKKVTVFQGIRKAQVNNIQVYINGRYAWVRANMVIYGVRRNVRLQKLFQQLHMNRARLNT